MRVYVEITIMNVCVCRDKNVCTYIFHHLLLIILKVEIKINTYTYTINLSPSPHKDG